MIEFFIPGEPVAKGRGRTAVIAGHAHVFTPTKTRDYENLVKLEARRAMGGRAPLDVAVAVSITIALPIPASFSWKQQGRAERGEMLPAKRPDLDNCAKAVCDGLNAIVFRDDALICELHVSKRYSLTPGVHVGVTPLVEASQRPALQVQRALVMDPFPF